MATSKGSPCSSRSFKLRSSHLIALFWAVDTCDPKPYEQYQKHSLESSFSMEQGPSGSQKTHTKVLTKIPKPKVFHKSTTGPYYNLIQSSPCLSSFSNFNIIFQSTAIFPK